MQALSTLRAAGYVRVSSEGQEDNFSVAAQRREVERHCASKGWSLKRIYADEGRSAWSDGIDKRPQFRQLLADLKQD